MVRLIKKFFVCVFFMYYLCVKYYKPVIVQYYIADCVIWIPRLTLRHKQIGLEPTLRVELICM